MYAINVALNYFAVYKIPMGTISPLRVLKVKQRCCHHNRMKLITHIKMRRPGKMRIRIVYPRRFRSRLFSEIS